VWQRRRTDVKANGKLPDLPLDGHTNNKEFN
jgi:hypothetical protein